MQICVTLWWLFFFSAIGLCVGSFLNVVIYRLPRDKSLRSPLWSACPHCNHRISWYDNLPVVSFILLRARCRHCAAPIATRYLVVEAGMAIVVLVLLDAFFIGQVRAGIIKSQFGITEGLSYDWPIFVAHIILFACLLSMSAIDLEHYWVDVRFTNVAVMCGFAMHALWTPRQSYQWLRPLDSTAMASFLALAGLAFVWIAVMCRPHMDAEDFGEEEDDPHASGGDLFGAASTTDPPTTKPPCLGGFLVLLLFVALFMVLALVGGAGMDWPHWPRALVPLALLYLMIVHESRVARESDHQIMEAIEQESPESRKMVLFEFALLLPAVVLAMVGLVLYHGSSGFAARVTDLLHIEVGVPGVPMMRHWQPLYGLATAASGYIIAGSIGWAVRIVFTMVFGREALGTGDIHLMAAAGCIAGWPVVLLGFLLTCGLAITGWIISLPFKRTRAIPLGPWLSLSFLAIVVFLDPILKWPVVERVIFATSMLFFKNSQP